MGDLFVAVVEVVDADELVEERRQNDQLHELRRRRARRGLRMPGLLFGVCPARAESKPCVAFERHYIA